MPNSVPTTPLDYERRDPPRTPRRPFWSVYFCASVVGFFLTDWAIAWMNGRPNRDGGVWFLEAFGIIAMTMLAAILQAFPRRSLLSSPWAAAIIGFAAPAIGLLLYSIFPWG